MRRRLYAVIDHDDGLKVIEIIRAHSAEAAKESCINRDIDARVVRALFDEGVLSVLPVDEQTITVAK